MLPKMEAYVKRYNDQTKWMYFMIEVQVDKSNCDIWKKFLKTKIKPYGDETTGFHNKQCLRQVLIILI